MRSSKFLVLAVVLALGACSSSSNPTDGPVKKDVPGKTPDQGPLPDGLPATSILQTVINALTLPASATDYAYDYSAKKTCPPSSGTTCKNQFGGIAGVLKTAGFDIQPLLDGSLNDGSFIMLFDVRGTSLTDSNPAVVQAYLGRDKTPGTTKEVRFGGSAEFTIDPNSRKDLVLQGKIAASKLTAGPGALQLIFNFSASGADAGTGKPIVVDVKQARIVTTLSSTPTSAMTTGTLYGLIPWTEVDGQFIPAIAQNVDYAYNLPTCQAGQPPPPCTTSTVKALIKSILDPTGTGHITADQIRSNQLLKLFLAPDVDSTGGSTPDSMSVGLAFTAVKAKFSTN